jgi:hypothetical protein
MPIVTTSPASLQSPAARPTPTPTFAESLAATRRALARANAALEFVGGLLSDTGHGPHDFTVDDLDTVNQWNDRAARQDAAARLADEVPFVTFEDRLDQAERLGWQGDDLVIPPGLTVAEEFAWVETFRDGRRQRERDEEWRAQERFNRGVVLA